MLYNIPYSVFCIRHSVPVFQMNLIVTLLFQFFLARYSFLILHSLVLLCKGKLSLLYRSKSYATCSTSSHISLNSLDAILDLIRWPNTILLCSLSSTSPHTHHQKQRCSAQHLHMRRTYLTHTISPRTLTPLHSSLLIQNN